MAQALTHAPHTFALAAGNRMAAQSLAEGAPLPTTGALNHEPAEISEDNAPRDATHHAEPGNAES